MKTPRTRVTAGEVRMMIQESEQETRDLVAKTLAAYTQKVLLPTLQEVQNYVYVPFYMRAYTYFRSRYIAWKTRRESEKVLASLESNPAWVGGTTGTTTR